MFQSAWGLLCWCCLVVQDLKSSCINKIYNRKRTKIVELWWKEEERQRWQCHDQINHHRSILVCVKACSIKKKDHRIIALFGLVVAFKRSRSPIPLQYCKVAVSGYSKPHPASPQMFPGVEHLLGSGQPVPVLYHPHRKKLLPCT